MVDKNCHNKQFVTISGVTISGEHCSDYTHHSILQTQGCAWMWHRMVTVSPSLMLPGSRSVSIST